ncbi:hypothetical protein BS47DRAFT_1388545 [Hydnum rufescens UP504]|uniref:Uncharacterized protein n=1 Tax=Hydnum rufescens UP504 TaxID=1448309 RepID=A0A9P6B7J1_9AGAM|nr:hypothetical protein BS47DRAFT_1388545 [Hydnum rufescens UP504]
MTGKHGESSCIPGSSPGRPGNVSISLVFRSSPGRPEYTSNPLFSWVGACDLLRLVQRRTLPRKSKVRDMSSASSTRSFPRFSLSKRHPRVADGREIPLFSFLRSNITVPPRSAALRLSSLQLLLCVPPVDHPFRRRSLHETLRETAPPPIHQNILPPLGSPLPEEGQRQSLSMPKNHIPVSASLILRPGVRRPSLRSSDGSREAAMIAVTPPRHSPTPMEHGPSPEMCFSRRSNQLRALSPAPPQD